MDLVYPRHCFVCDEILYPWEWNKGIHDECKKDIVYVGTKVCARCGAPVYGNYEYCVECARNRQKNRFTQGKSVYIYKGQIKKTMYLFKYSNRREYAQTFAKEAVKLYADWILRNNMEVIIPVPMYKKKLRKRGYNQAEAFAKELSKELELQTGKKLPVLTKGILRSKDTKPLKTLSKEERYNNLKNAFQISASVIEYRKIALVVDDIYTTGATANSLSEALQLGGFEKVFFLSVCIGRGL